MDNTNPQGFENFEGSEFEVDAVGQNKMQNKIFFDPSKVENSDKGQKDLVKVENLTNRTFRHPNQSVTQTIVHRINMISADTNSTGLNTFNSDSTLEFDRWSSKFIDFLDFYGDTWTEGKKLNRLKLFLDGTPRRIFDGLAANEKDNVQNALINLRSKLDSPQRRELTYQALSACKQKENEPVNVFLDRLIPLVEATAGNIKSGAKEEILCRTLLEKLEPQISFILRTAGLGGKRKFDELCMQAQEAEMILANTPNMKNPLLNAHAGNDITTSSSCSPGLQTWAQVDSSPSNPDFPNQDTWSGSITNQSENWNTLRGTINYSHQDDSIQNSPSDNFRWNSRPFCHYCKRPGHISVKCFQRENDVAQMDQINSVSEDDRLVIMVEELAADMHELKLRRIEENNPTFNQNVRSLTKPVKLPEWERINSPKKTIQLKSVVPRIKRENSLRLQKAEIRNLSNAATHQLKIDERKCQNKTFTGVGTTGYKCHRQSCKQ